MSVELYLPNLFTQPSLLDISTYTLNKSRMDRIKTIRDSKNDIIIEDEPTVKEEIPTNIETIDDKFEKYTLRAAKAIDTLFWSIYIAHHGMNEFMRVGVNNGNEEMKEKKRIADYLHKTPHSFMNNQSNYKITKVFITDIISDLLTCPKTNWSGLVAMSLFYQCNIFVVDYERKFYLPFVLTNVTSQVNTYVLYRNPLYNYKDKNSTSYYVDIDYKIMNIEDITNNMVALLHYEKPLKGISAYKTSELEHMADILGVATDDEHDKKLKKNELYTRVLMKCIWEKELK